jgi:hypothetical protein
MKEMIRKIFVPKEKEYILEIPDSLIGKSIELLAFEVKVDEPIKREKTEVEDVSYEKEDFGKFKSFGKRTQKLRYSSKGYKFSREEANDYQ